MDERQRSAILLRRVIVTDVLLKILHRTNKVGIQRDIGLAFPEGERRDRRVVVRNTNAPEGYDEC